MERSPTVNEIAAARPIPAARVGAGHFNMAAVLLSLGYFLIWPVLFLLVNSFNAAADWFVELRAWGLKHWENAFQRVGLLGSLGNSLLVWSLTVIISFPIGVAIAWILARTKIPFSHTLEFMFWVSYMVPSAGGQALQSKQFCLLSVNKEVWLMRASPGDDVESKM